MADFLKKLRNRDQRGAALVEFAIAVPIFLALLAVVFDAGLGYADSRSSASAARSSARVGALAGESRNADFVALDAIRGEYINRNDVDIRRVVVYKSSPGDSAVATIAACASSVPGLCNVYSGSDIAALSSSSFLAVEPRNVGDICNATDPDPISCTCASGSIDGAWCPLDRRADDGSFLGVYIETTSDSTIGLINDEFDLQDRAVFALYFPPLPVPAATAT